VRASQRKARRAVIENSCLPRNRVVAQRAGRHGEAIGRSRMIGVCGLLPGCQVALRVPAIRRRDLKVVVVVDVARGAGHVRVAVREQKARCAVVKFRP